MDGPEAGTFWYLRTRSGVARYCLVSVVGGRTRWQAHGSADVAIRPFHGDVLAYWGGSRCDRLHLVQQDEQETVRLLCKLLSMFV